MPSLSLPTPAPHCGSFADDDWQEAHERLAELEDKPVANREQDGPSGEDSDLLGEPEDTLAERLTRLVIDSELEDPAIMQAVQTKVPTQVGMGLQKVGHSEWGSQQHCAHSVSGFQQPGGLNSSIWDSSAVLRRIRGPLLTQVWLRGWCWGGGDDGRGGFTNASPRAQQLMCCIAMG